MNKQERLELAHWITTRAKQFGADEASAHISKTRDVGVTYRDGKLEELKESTQNSLNLNIYAEKKYSGHSTNDLRKESLEPFIEEAVAMTRYLGEDPDRMLPDPRYYTMESETNLDLVDKNYDKMTTDRRVEIARAIAEIGKSQSDKIISCSGDFGDSYAETVLVNSNGFEGQRVATVFYSGSGVTVNDGDGRPEDYYYGVTRYAGDLPDPETCGREAARRALAKMGQKKLPSGRYDMIVENRTASRLLGALYGPMTARYLHRKNSFLDGKLGQKIGSDKLTMIDDPFIPRAMGSRRYDSDGIATRRRTMIEKGVLKEYYVDNYYGRKLGMEPTCSGTTNIVLPGGDGNLDDMIASSDKAILVTGFLGGNSNSTTGDFSYGIVGQLIEGGKIVHAVNEMNISGYLVDLWQQLSAVGADPYVYSSWRLPSLRFSDVEFSGV